MKFDHASNTYKLNNEDAYGFTQQTAWVMDGASPLNKTCLTGEPNDVIWVTRWWTPYLNQHLNNLDQSIINILQTGVEALNRDFSAFADLNTLSKLDRASSSIGIIRHDNLLLECYVLGDIEIAILFNDGKTRVVTDETIQEMDLTTMEIMAANPNREKELVFNNYTAEELKVLRENRLKMNSNDGYYILEHDPEAIPKGVYETFDLSSIQSIMLMSDGFSALYNKYHCYTLPELFRAVQSLGATALLSELRAIENNDPFMTQHKRLRKNDDSTVIYIEKIA